MLQYILTQSENYPVAELAQMAVEGGCMWISLHLPGLSDDEIKAAVVPDVMDMCREQGVILTVDDRPELARELGLHGVRLSLAYFTSHPGATPAALREQLGPEAVIGVECISPSAVPGLSVADIDFVTVPESFDAGRRQAFVKAVRETGSEMPLVAQGDFGSDDVSAVMAEGFNGLAVGPMITEADDPVAATEAILKAFPM